MNSYFRQAASGSRVCASLIWKEWREQRIVIGLMVLAAALLPEAVWPVKAAREILPQLAFYMWIVFALVLGAGMFTTDSSSRANEFPGTHALKGGTVWSAKMIFGIIILLALMLLSWVMVHLKSSAEGLPPDFRFLWRWWDDYSRLGRANCLPPPSYVTFAAFLLAMALLLVSLVSSLMSRGLVAFVVSLIICVLCGTANHAMLRKFSHVFSDLDYQPSGHVLISLAIPLAIGSYVAFTRRAGPALRRLCRAAAGMVVGLPIAALCTVGWCTLTERLPSLCAVSFERTFMSGEGITHALRPGGGMVAIEVGSGLWSPRIWLVATDGSGAQRIPPGFSELTLRHLYHPWSADGSHIVYVTHTNRNFPYFRSKETRCILYDVGSNRSRCLPIGRPLSQYDGGNIGFVGNNGRVLFDVESQIALYHPDGKVVRYDHSIVLESGWAGLNWGSTGPERWVNLQDGRTLEDSCQRLGRILNISPSGRWLVLSGPLKNPRAPSACDISVCDTAQKTAIHITQAEMEGLFREFMWYSSFSADERLLAIQYSTKWGDPKAVGLLVFDVMARKVVFCKENGTSSYTSAFSPDGRWLLYCQRAAMPGNVISTMVVWHMVELRSGKDDALRAAPGAEFCFPCWSPDGSRIAYTTSYLYPPTRLIVFDPAKKETRETPFPVQTDFIRPMGWVDNGTVLVITCDPCSSSALWSAKADGSGLKRLFP